jgi:SOUL heme-binding protein
MPAGYTLQSLPKPNDGRVHFEQSKARRLAAIRFSVFWTDTNIKSHEKQLLQWMLRQHITAESAPIYAYYDPLWTPWFMRRIAVLIQTTPSSQTNPSF